MLKVTLSDIPPINDYYCIFFYKPVDFIIISNE